MNTPINHYLIFDPVAFLGGSKIASKEALLLTNPNHSKYTILTAHKESWSNDDFCKQHQVNVITVPSIAGLSKVDNGLGYWLKQCIYTLFILAVWLRSEKITALIGNSGPGVDMSLYIVKKLINIPIIQLIHGPIEKSRSVGYCLTIADRVYYLSSAKNSVYKALNHYLRTKLSGVDAYALSNYLLLSENYQSFQNGISNMHWPSRVQYDFPTIFWCASLLKWKGLDMLTESARKLDKQSPFAANICFIRPIDTSLPTCNAPTLLPHVQWYQEPKNLDEIRSRSNIFVSTSRNEPFGLSILEAMAAGMCIIIPEDNAYWDQVLTHNVNCIKYEPNCVSSLTEAISRATHDVDLIKTLGSEAFNVAKQYQAENCYRSLVNGLNHPDFINEEPSLIPTKAIR
ncbi:glycosyltransferase family 4 protein [Vibrio lamellibrachiae]|uniref:glycosyltransferase family 4 protein n=1 Tax=Vibrio lamellibrachiae TaxID=2910253 RepID=UPI003D11046F